MSKSGLHALILIALTGMLSLHTLAQSSGSYVVEPVPLTMYLDPFYEKYVDASGYPVVSSAKVNDYALLESAYIVDRMLAKRPDIRKAMVESGSRLIVMGYQEYSTDIPE